jgi:glycosyltransferase involved in cell wall biosynthesis
MLCRPPTALYAAFDVFPSRKGAAVHIDRFARALFDRMGGGLLYVLGDGELPAHQCEEGGIEIVRHDAPARNYLSRAFSFGARLDWMVRHHGGRLELCHFRDIWGGLPLLQPGRRHAALFEVNALPSIELPFAYDRMAPATLAKLRAHELHCLQHADHIVTPSGVLRRKLESLGVPAARITVIPNGAELVATQPRPPEAPPRYLIYFGALQPWQGVDVLLRAFARLADLPDLHLVICASHLSRHVKGLQRLAENLQVTPRVHWHFALVETALAPWREHAVLSVAPLTECARNVEQGCAPLKILESMAAGVPVVAADLPAVRELMRDGEHGRLVRPDRPGELARAIRVLLNYPAVLGEMGRQARERVRREFQWSQAVAQLEAAYSELLARRKGETLQP